uniref:Replication protein E1 n=1 Tax=Rhinolophus ferrumequinum papillomavirus 2 TaxID=3140014 RepID=A0AAU6S4X9_9PAPI
MEDKTGTDEPGCSGWCFVDAEAECSEGGDDFEELCGSEHLSLLDDSPKEQGESLKLMNELDNLRDEQQLSDLKRKLLGSPAGQDAVDNLSPRLEKVRITPRKSKKAKKVLSFNDSGVAGDSFVESTASTSDPDCSESPAEASPAAEAGIASDGDPGQAQAAAAAPQPTSRGAEAAAADVAVLLKSNNCRATLMCKFKEIIGVPFSELTRKFTSPRTMSERWCCAIYGICEPFFETVKALLQEHCEFMCLNHYAHEKGLFMLALLEFRVQKCKDTVWKLLKNLMLVQQDQTLVDPPKTRSAATALFWYKQCIGNRNTYGQMPDWIARQVLIEHQMDSERPFDLSVMVQWAYDNEVMDECFIAHKYAGRAAEDPNARAFLNSNQQAKIVRDCATMVNLYKRAELRMCTMSQWIHKRCAAVTPGDGNEWKQIVLFLRFQKIDFVSFLGAFKSFLKGEPKRSCIALCGLPDSGKSTFAMSFIKFMKGRVVTFANHSSQFWLSPLLDTKVGLVDDVTHACLRYFDSFLRGGLDGNEVCIDSKHRKPTQIKMPPILLTSNVDIPSSNEYIYLHSRIVCFQMSERFPLREDGTPLFQLDDKSWQSFFARFWSRLDLSDQEDDGETQHTLRISSRRSSEPI